jgi:polysaccharide transporter, PST family
VAPALTVCSRGLLAEYERRFLQVTRLLVWIAVAVAASFALLAKPIILALFGARYVEAAPVLAIHAWAGVLVSLGVCGTLWLTNAGYLTYTMYQTVAGAVVNIALNLVMIPRFGAVGAALASVGGQFASVMLTTVALPATRRLFRLQLAALVPGR